MPDESPFEEIDNDALVESIQKGDSIREMMETPGWIILTGVCRRAAEKAAKAILEVDPTDVSKIAQYQQMVKLYGRIIGSLVESLKSEGDLAKAEAKKRGIFDKIFGGRK